MRSYEADPLGRLQVPILCRLLQVAATAHAAKLGVAVDALVGRGTAWVLSRLDVQVEAVPDGVWKGCDLREFSIQFLAECRRGQIVVSRCQLLGDDDAPEVRHQLVRKEDGVEGARARTVWRRAGDRPSS